MYTVLIVFELFCSLMSGKFWIRFRDTSGERPLIFRIIVTHKQSACEIDIHTLATTYAHIFLLVRFLGYSNECSNVLYSGFTTFYKGFCR